MKIARKIGIVALCIVLIASSGITAFANDTPSSWATNQVTAAIDENLVPQNLRSDYTQAITRAEFCALAVSLYETVKDEIKGRTSFADTSDVNVEKMAYISVVTGVGDNTFDPDGTLSREQAAVILSRLSDALDQPFPKQQSFSFSDNNSIATWAVESVGRVQGAGIMQGVDNNRFAPQQQYTREQSIVTILRTFELVKSEEMETIVTEPTNSFEVQYIRSNGYVGGENYPVVTVITSVKELEEYSAANNSRYDLSSRGITQSDTQAGFIEAIEKYSESFFTNSYLVVVLLEEISGSIRHKVDSVNADGDIVINRLQPEIGTDDMAEWNIIIELENSFMPETFNIILN